MEVFNSFLGWGVLFFISPWSTRVSLHNSLTLTQTLILSVYLSSSICVPPSPSSLPLPPPHSPPSPPFHHSLALLPSPPLLSLPKVIATTGEVVQAFSEFLNNKGLRSHPTLPLHLLTSEIYQKIRPEYVSAPSLISQAESVRPCTCLRLRPPGL